jgi:hypothetical protein
MYCIHHETYATVILFFIKYCLMRGGLYLFWHEWLYTGRGRFLHFSDAPILKNVFFFSCGSAKQDWLNNEENVYLVDVSWFPIGQQCILQSFLMPQFSIYKKTSSKPFDFGGAPKNLKNQPVPYLYNV